MDKLVVTQGVRFVEPPKTTTLGIPAAIDKPKQLPTGKTEPHVFESPTNTAGLARFKGHKRKPVVTSQRTPAQATAPVVATEPAYHTCRQSSNQLAASQPKYSLADSKSSHLVIASDSIAPTPTSQSIFHMPPQQPTPAEPTIPKQTTPVMPLQMFTVNIDGKSYQLTQSTSQVCEMSVPSTAVPSNVPYTTQRYRKRKLEKEQQGIVKRKYERKNQITCRYCGQERKPPNHMQYFMNWYCVTTATISFEEWKDELTKKGYGRKPKK